MLTAAHAGPGDLVGKAREGSRESGGREASPRVGVSGRASSYAPLLPAGPLSAPPDAAQTQLRALLPTAASPVSSGSSMAPLRHHSDRGPRAVSAECPAARGPAPPLPPPQGLVALIRVSTLLFGPACRLQTGPGGHLASWGRPMGAHALRLTGELCAAESPCSGALSSWSSGPDSDPGKRSCRAPARALHTSRRKEGV